MNYPMVLECSKIDSSRFMNKISWLTKNKGSSSIPVERVGVRSSSIITERKQKIRLTSSFNEPQFHNNSRAKLVDFSKIFDGMKYTASQISVSKTNSPINNAIGRIRTLGLYEDGWEGIDSIKASKKTIVDAEELARILFKHKILEPSISLANDGEINFYWNFDGNKLDLGVFGDGCYSYYFLGKDGSELFADDREVKSIVNDEILETITF